MSTTVATFSPLDLQPWMRPDLARTDPVQVAPSLTVARGQIMAVIAATGLVTPLSSTVVTPGSGFSLSATGSDGTIPAGAYSLGYTFVNGNGETTISNVPAVTVGATNHIVVPTITKPATVTSVNLYMSAIGTTTPLYFVKNYDGTGFNLLAPPAASDITPPATNSARTATDGSESARYISRFDFVSDANSIVILGPSGSVVDLTMTGLTTIPMWKAGDFLISDLVGYDAGVKNNLNATEFGVSTGKWVHIP